MKRLMLALIALMFTVPAASAETIYGRLDFEIPYITRHIDGNTGRQINRIVLDVTIEPNARFMQLHGSIDSWGRLGGYPVVGSCTNIRLDNFSYVKNQVGWLVDGAYCFLHTGSSTSPEGDMIIQIGDVDNDKKLSLGDSLMIEHKAFKYSDGGRQVDESSRIYIAPKIRDVLKRDTLGIFAP